MERKEIVIKVDNERIHFNRKLSIPIQQTNIPWEYMKFRSHEELFWIVEMIEYDKDLKTLRVAVKKYSTRDITKFEQQQPNNNVLQLIFEKVDWKELDPLLRSHQKSMLKEFIFNAGTPILSKDEYPDFTPPPIIQPNISTPPIIPTITRNQSFDRNPVIRFVNETFSVDFNELHFLLGFITFKGHVKQVGREIEFKIHNEHILAEFDSIKFWFARKLKTKKIKVAVTITLTDGAVTDVDATSVQIDQITPEFIESVKHQRILGLTQDPPNATPDNSLFTIEDIFKQVDIVDVGGNLFNQSIEDVFEILFKGKNIRNRKHLEYLAGQKQSENYKLLYTLRPNFGFLFLIEGDKNNSFVWELLNSNATYIWSIEKKEEDTSKQIERVENSINVIKQNKREYYKRAYKNNEIDSDVIFKVLYHDNISSNPIDAFSKWKSKLNTQLFQK